MEGSFADVEHGEVGHHPLHARHAGQRQAARRQELGIPALVGVHHGHHDVLGRGHEVHGAAHPLDHAARDFPVGDVAALAHFHGAEHRELDVLASDHGKRGRAVKVDCSGERRDGLLARIDQVGVHLCLRRERPHAEDAILALEFHGDALGNVVRHQRRDADAEVDVPTVPEFLRDAPRDAILVQHRSIQM